MYAKGVGKCSFPTPFALVVQRLQFISVMRQGISLLDSLGTMVTRASHVDIGLPQFRVHKDITSPHAAAGLKPSAGSTKATSVAWGNNSFMNP